MDVTSRRELSQVLHPQRSDERTRVGRAAAPESLASNVDYLWWVRWDTPERFTQSVIPRPVVHVTAEIFEGEARLLVHGPTTRLFRTDLEGVGRTVAAAFRPGGFRPFIDHDVVELVDRVVPVDNVVGVDDRSIATRVLDPKLSDEQSATELASWLVLLDPRPDPMVSRIADLAEKAERDPTIVRAHQLARLAAVSERTLQRWFRVYVGVSPKAMVQRHRLLDVAAAANASDHVDWAQLASTLGYTDQSHLINHFRNVVGEPPAQYRSQHARA